MIVVSMALVVMGFIALLLGVLNVGIGDVEPITFVYGAIGACVLAGLALIVGVLRSRPRDRPVTADSGRASWSGAADRSREPVPAGSPSGEPERARAAGHVRVTPRPAAQEPAPAPPAEPAPEPAEPAPEPAPAPVERPAEPAEPAPEPAEPAPSVEPPPGPAPEPEEPALPPEPTLPVEPIPDATQPAPAAPAGPVARLRAVPGVGPAKERALLEHFGSVDAVAAASVAELAAVKGVSERLAEQIHAELSG